ncbi:30S ribosomal protein S4 [Patescibacteria group bacterium]
MSTTKCKTCRRTGQKLFLKEEKCLSFKCPLTRKAYPPGKRAKRFKMLSEFGQQLKEKQKLKFMYGLRERQFVKYVRESMKKGGSDTGLCILQCLESRLDNVIYRLGIAKSRSGARQIVNHGHICVNGRKVSIPSFKTKLGDKISIRPESVSRKVFSDMDIWLKKYTAPGWLKLDKEKKEGEIIKHISKNDTDTSVNLSAIIGYYSR